MNISKLDFDWRSLLIKRYKNYGLNENDIAVIFCINEIIKEKKYLVLADDIEPLMTLKKEEIDNIITKLFERRFISFEENNNKTVTSLDPLITKIFSDTQKDLMIEAQDNIRVTIAAVDKMILALEKSADINQEGYTTRSEDWRQGTAKTIEQLKGKWLQDDK